MLHEISATASLNISPITDQNPYFFNMLKLNNLGAISDLESGGVVAGNLTATLTLITLIIILTVLIVSTILIPMLIHTRRMSGASSVLLHDIGNQ
ncbi:MAG: hypothetical protein O7G88_08815 [bacterium]|nr:hypothetical protein [bacterium]